MHILRCVYFGRIVQGKCSWKITGVKCLGGGEVRGVGLEPGKIQKYIYIIVEYIIILSIFDYSVLIT